MSLHVHHAGDPAGPPVLALHGVTGHGLRFRPLTALLGELRWIAPDLRGHGRSPWAPPWRFEQHALDALAVLDDLGIERAAIVGHSFGGAVATYLARIAPERVERLVLLDPAIGLDPQDMLEAADDTRTDESWPTREAARADKAESWAGSPAETVDDEIAEHLEERDGAFRFRYSPSALIGCWSELARPAITPPSGIPTLVLPATGADFVSDAWLAACRDSLGDLLTVTPVEAGHMLYQEKPAEVAELLKAFLHG